MLVGKKAEVKTTDGKVLKGYGDCYVWLPINDDTDEEEEYLRFILESGETEYLSETDIVEYKIQLSQNEEMIEWIQSP